MNGSNGRTVSTEQTNLKMGGVEMKVTTFLRVSVITGLTIIVLVIVSLTASAQYTGHLSTGVSSTGSEGTTGTSSGGESDAAGNISTPSGFTETGEDSIFAGFSVVANQTAPGGSGADGGLFVGAGFGKPGKSFELTFTIADVSEFSDLVVSGRLGFQKESGSIPAIALGVEGLFEVPGQLEHSPYIVASKTFPQAKIPFIASLGWGGGRFEDNFFGALAIVLKREMNFIVEYDGAGGNLGLSYALKKNLVLTLAWQDAFASEQESTLALGGAITFH